MVTQQGHRLENAQFLLRTGWLFDWEWQRRKEISSALLVPRDIGYLENGLCPCYWLRGSTMANGVDFCGLFGVGCYVYMSGSIIWRPCCSGQTTLWSWSSFGTGNPAYMTEVMLTHPFLSLMFFTKPIHLFSSNSYANDPCMRGHPSSFRSLLPTSFICQNHFSSPSFYPCTLNSWTHWILKSILP